MLWGTEQYKKTTDDRVHGKLAQCLESWTSQTGGDAQFGAVRRAYDILVNGNGAAVSRKRQSRNLQQMPREAPRVSLFREI
jgi:hypothetical protein